MSSKWSSNKYYYLYCIPLPPAAAQPNKEKPSTCLPICLRFGGGGAVRNPSGPLFDIFVHFGSPSWSSDGRLKVSGITLTLLRREIEMEKRLRDAYIRGRNYFDGVGLILGGSNYPPPPNNYELDCICPYIRDIQIVVFWLRFP